MAKTNTFHAVLEKALRFCRDASSFLLLSISYIKILCKILLGNKKVLQPKEKVWEALGSTYANRKLEEKKKDNLYSIVNLFLCVSELLSTYISWFRKCRWLVYSHELGSEILRMYAGCADSPLFVLDSVGTTVRCTCLRQHTTATWKLQIMDLLAKVESFEKLLWATAVAL